MPSPTKEFQRGETLFPRHVGKNPRPAHHSRLPGTAAHEGTAELQAFGKSSLGQQALPSFPWVLPVWKFSLPTSLLLCKLSDLIPMYSSAQIKLSELLLSATRNPDW